MTLMAGQRDQKPGVMFFLSLVLHLIVIFVCTRAQLFRAELHEAPTYYVDIVSLPTISPAPGGAPTPTPAAPSPPPPLQATSQPPPAPAKPAMALPAKSATAQKNAPSPQQAPDAAEQEAREFRERLNRLEHATEARRQAAALEALQKKVAAARQGAPAASGSAPGSDYAAYIQSRLRDALATTMVYRSKQPEAFVHLYIDKKGKLLRYVMEKPSSD